jgi:hypothetical protein
MENNITEMYWDFLYKTISQLKRIRVVRRIKVRMKAK